MPHSPTNTTGNYNQRATNKEAILVPLLAARSCHLPGNSWFADWVQWFKNTHIIFGICLHHRLHPVEGWERCLLLASSLAYGLMATNILYQINRYNMYDETEELVTYSGYTITHGMILLWTFGGLCHSIFDIITWHIVACACCHPGGRWGDHSQSKRYKDCGSYALIPLIAALLGFAVFLVLLRATAEEDEEENNNGDDYADNLEQNENIDTHIDIHDWKAFSFLSQYAIEVALAWFVYSPIVGTIVFSGILGCKGRLPILGGRPRDLKRVQEGRFGHPNQQSQNYTRF